ncbi:hypothetical protein EVA_03436 [gut metagenome]|uniref:Uncharacterized protein n=1 Tax=gut metagenome TaxID=749906 RepID=J9H404_9ZZZZ
MLVLIKFSKKIPLVILRIAKMVSSRTASCVRSKRKVASLQDSSRALYSLSSFNGRISSNFITLARKKGFKRVAWTSSRRQ